MGVVVRRFRFRAALLQTRSRIMYQVFTCITPKNAERTMCMVCTCAIEHDVGGWRSAWGCGWLWGIKSQCRGDRYVMKPQVTHYVHYDGNPLYPLSAFQISNIGIRRCHATGRLAMANKRRNMNIDIKLSAFMSGVEDIFGARRS